MTRKDEPEDDADSIILKAFDARLARALRPSKIVQRWLAAVVVVLMAVCTILGVAISENANNGASLRQDSIDSCNSGNDLRHDLDVLIAEQGEAETQITEQAIAEFIDVLEGSHPSTQVVTIVKNLEAQIKASSDRTLATFKTELDLATQPRNCQAAYDTDATTNPAGSAIVTDN